MVDVQGETLWQSSISRHTGSPVIDLTQEANHRISNQLALIASVVQTRASALARGPELLPRDEVREILRTTAGKIATVAHLHRKLAQQEGGDRIELGEYLIECCAILAKSLAPAGRVGLVQRLDKDCHVTAQTAQAVGLIVNEVMTNSVKHSHPTGIPVEIRLSCRRGTGHNVEIEIEDDGVGLPEGFDYEASKSVGFTLIRSLARTLNASLTVESDSLGMSFRLIVPCEV